MVNKQWSGSNRSQRLPSNWAALRAAVLKRDNYTCYFKGLGCEGRATEVDHVKAGDDHRPENLKAICRTCHKGKSSREGNQAKAALRAARFRKKPAHPGRRVK